jgi:hypothetical protein
MVHPGKLLMVLWNVSQQTPHVAVLWELGFIVGLTEWCQFGAGCTWQVFV